MKMLNLISAIAVLGFAMNSNAVTYKFVGADNSRDTKMCLAAVTNDKPALRRQILMSGKNVRTIARYLMCNDHIVANFAYKYGATETFEYLDRFTPKKYKEKRPSVTIQDIGAIPVKTTAELIARN